VPLFALFPIEFIFRACRSSAFELFLSQPKRITTKGKKPKKKKKLYNTPLQTKPYATTVT